MSRQTSKQLRERLLIELASIVYRMAPPDDQRTIGRLMDMLHSAEQEEEYQRYDV